MAGYQDYFSNDIVNGKHKKLVNLITLLLVLGLALSIYLNLVDKTYPFKNSVYIFVLLLILQMCLLYFRWWNLKRIGGEN